MNTINFTHHDLDGILSHIVLKTTFPDIELVSGTYRNINDFFEKHVVSSSTKYDHIFITDISLDEERFKEFLLKSTNIHLIDHHPISEKTIINKKLFSIEYSGCALTLQYLKKNFGQTFTEKMQRLIELGNDYDIWKHEFLLSKYLNRLFYHYTCKKFIERFKDGFDNLNEDERIFLKKNNDYLKNVFQNINFIKLEDHIIVAFTKEGNVDEICQYLLSTNIGVDTVFHHHVESGVLSMRGKYRGIDFGEFLKEFGGGGHKEAAGVRITTEKEFDTLVNSYITKYNNIPV